MRLYWFYGRYPRLILSHIIDQALTYKRREIELTHSLAGYLKNWEFQQAGLGKYAHRKAYQKHPRRMCHAARRFISAEYTIRKSTMTPMEKCLSVTMSGIWKFQAGTACGGQNKPRSGRLWPSFIILTEEFYNEIIEHAVPLYKGALRETGSGFCLDIYMWSTFRAAYFEKYDKKECVRIPAALKNQFGADYKQLKTFRYWFRHYLAEYAPFIPGWELTTQIATFWFLNLANLIPSQKLYLAKSTSK